MAEAADDRATYELGGKRLEPVLYCDTDQHVFIVAADPSGEELWLLDHPPERPEPLGGRPIRGAYCATGDRETGMYAVAGRVPHGATGVRVTIGRYTQLARTARGAWICAAGWDGERPGVIVQHLDRAGRVLSTVR